MDWYELKEALAQLTALSRDALHVHLGLIAFLLVALVTRRPLRHPLPWLAVLILAVANEVNDLAYETWPERTLQWLESIRDILNTMTQPTLLLLLARFIPSRLTAPPAAPAEDEQPAGEAQAEETARLE